MDELGQWLNEHGFNITPVLDGNVKRFPIEGDLGNEKTGWYKGSVTVLPNGKEITSLTISDWKTSERLYFRSGGFHNGDYEKYREETNRQTAGLEKEADERFTEAIKKAEEIISKSLESDGSHGYLVHKHIKPNGVRVDLQKRLIIPFYREGQLHGLQFITEGGEKRFLPGSKKMGAFFTFHGEGFKKIQICEGYATASSVFEATGVTTAVAFDCGNLEKVGLAIRRAYPESQIIICGDDDRFAENGKNPGREAAELAAKSCGGVAIFPEFKNECGGIVSLGEDGKFQEIKKLEELSDFNDLHVMEGMDAVKRQIEREADKTNPVGDKESGIGDDYSARHPNEETSSRPIVQAEDCGGAVSDEKEVNKNCYVNYLGHSDDLYFYTSSSNKQIVKLSRSSHKWSGLADLMPYDYWIGNYPSYTAKGKLSGVNWELAAVSIMESCRAIGIFNPEKIRGAGCWSDKEHLVIHLGNKIIVDKNEFQIGKFQSGYIYELGKELPRPAAVPLTDENCSKIIKAVFSLKWKSKDDAIYFLGWLAISRISGALNWRPHVWLTGPSGSGKSTVLEMIVKKLVGDWGLQIIGASSEAGIRQAIGKDSRPIVFDEAETTNERSGRKIQTILELVRQASSNTDSKIMKGTADQSGLQFKINCLFLLSSIRVNLVEEADKNRFTICELLRNNPGDWPEIQNNINAIEDDFGNMLFSRSIQSFDSILRCKEIAGAAIAKKHNQRIGQQYGTLLAGYLSMLSGSEPSKSKIEEFVRTLDISDKNILEIEEDETECLNWILNYKIRVPDSGGDITEELMSELLDKAIQEMQISSFHYRDLLQTYGLKVLDPEKVILKETEPYLCIAKHHCELVKILGGTKWANGLWDRALKRVNGAMSYKTRFSKGNPIWCVKIPLSVCVPK